MRARSAAIALAGILAACGGTPTSTTATPTATPALASTTPSRTAGFGSTDAAWSESHPADLSKNPGAAYGPKVSSGGSLTDEFAGVSHVGGRVDGWEMAFADDTNLAVAKAAVMALLPSDASTISYRIGQTSNGTGQCALWNLRSPTLASLLGNAPWGDSQGDIGVVLYTVIPGSIDMAYDPSNINSASLSIAANAPDTAC